MKGENVMTFSDNLKKYRQQKNLTQEQVAEKLGVNAHTVSRWECNITLPDVTLLPEIAQLYGVIVDDFFKETTVAYANYAQRLASVYEFTQDPDDFMRADAEFRKLIRAGTMTAEDMWVYGVMHQMMMNYCKERSLHWYDEAVEEAGTTDEYVYGRARSQKMKLLAQIGQAEQTIREQHAKIETDSEVAKEWCLLLCAYMYAERYEEAYEWFVKAISLFPDCWELYLHGGDICKKLKRYDEAFQYWDKAGEFKTDFLDEKYSKAFCYEELGEHEKAYNLWCEIATYLRKDGYDVEALEAEKRANGNKTFLNE